METALYSSLATNETITATISALKENNFDAEVLDSKEDALKRIQELIPKGASVMNGSSRTLEAIGYTDYLKSGAHGWNNLHEAILAEKDPAKQALLRRQSVVSDYYLGSVHALTETGEMIIASNTGSQLPHLVFTSQNLILVVGSQKITPSVAIGLDRLLKYVMPLENKRMQVAYKMDTHNSKTLILHRENPTSGRTVKVLIVKESLGF